MGRVFPRVGWLTAKSGQRLARQVTLAAAS